MIDILDIHDAIEQHHQRLHPQKVFGWELADEVGGLRRGELEAASGHLELQNEGIGSEGN